MTRYRIYTEHKNYQSIVDLASKTLKGCTIYPGLTGVWENVPESSLVIEYLGGSNEKDIKTIHRLAKDIKELNSQQSVLITTETVDARFI